MTKLCLLTHRHAGARAKVESAYYTETPAPPFLPTQACDMRTCSALSHVCSQPPSTHMTHTYTHNTHIHTQGDAEDLPFTTDSFDRYTSAGSIE